MSGFEVSPLAAGGIVLGLLMAVAMLYLLHPPARRVLVPSNLIWERVLRAAHRVDDRLRWWVSLLLALAIAGCLAAAFLHLRLPGAAPSEGREVVVVDDSLTMATRTADGSTRFEHARARARELLGAMPAGAQVMLADTMRAIATPCFDTPRAALETLAGLEVVRGTDPAVPDLVASAPAEKFHVLTDGVLLRNLPRRAMAVSVYEPVENVGITAFRVRAVPGDSGRYEAFVEVSSDSGASKEIELTLSGAGAPRVTRRLLVPAGSAVNREFDVSSFVGGPLRAALTALGDGFVLDDVAYGYLPTHRALRVTLVSDSNPYLEKSLVTQPRVRLTVVPPQRFVDRGDADLYVFDRFAPRQPPSAPALLVRPGRANWLPAAGGELVEPQVARWDAGHPVLENLSLRDLYIEKAQPPRLDATGEARALVATGTGEPLVAASDGARRWVMLSFSLAQSNFGLHAGFPVFLNNVLQWTTDDSPMVDAKLGAIELPLERARIIAMDGTELAVQAIPGATRFEAGEPGVYTAIHARGRMRVVVNLTDPRVTRLNHSVLPPAPAGTLPPTSARPPDPNLVLLTLAVALLLLEWITYNRRVTV
ncbi:MAG TPA: BatA domain-containing protein [Burkholderiales bacterium]|nr:BatA domain-containing protein [Burkholderiales bacterium]